MPPYATSGHKWLGGPRGTGLLLVRQDRIESVVSWHVGAYSVSEVELPNRLELHPTALRFEYGTRNTELVAGLGSAMKFQESIGKKRIEDRSMELAKRLRERLSKSTVSQFSLLRMHPCEEESRPSEATEWISMKSIIECPGVSTALSPCNRGGTERSARIDAHLQ